MACRHGKRLCRPCEREAERRGSQLVNNDMLSKHAAINERGVVYTGMSSDGEQTSKTIALMMSIGEAPTPERAKALLTTMFGRYPTKVQLRRYRADLHKRGATYD